MDTDGPTDRTPFVLFGHGNTFGDLVELIHAVGGYLRCVVQNIPEVPRPGYPSLADRLARFRDPAWNPQGVNGYRKVAVVPLDDFVPQPGDAYLLGFTGAKNAMLARHLRDHHGLAFATLVHPTAVVSPTARIGEGTMVHAYAVLGSGAEVGAHCYVNKAALVAHDSVVGDHCVLSPGARLAGQVRVGCGAYIGMGASVLEDLRVGDHSVIAAGAVVIEDVPEYVMAAGVPARVRKSLEPSFADVRPERVRA